MREFQLVRVRRDGKTYEDCVLSVDDASRQAEVKYTVRKVFKSTPVSLTKFEFDSKTVVARGGASVKVGDLEIVASSPEDSAQIESIFSAPRKTVLEQAEREVAEAEMRVLDFLNTRSETLAFLERLRRDPAEVMLQLHLSRQSPTEDPLQLFLNSRAEATAASLGRLDTALADLGTKTSPQVAERVYAVAYVIGLLQNNIFEKGEAGIAAGGFISELGFNEGDLRSSLQELPAKLLQASRKSTVALLG